MIRIDKHGKMEVIPLVKVGHRKERSDKKRQVKPLIPLETKEQIFRISHVTQTPIKDICEFWYLTLLDMQKRLIRYQNTSNGL